MCLALHDLAKSSFRYFVHRNQPAKHARKFYASFLYIEFKREFREEKTVTRERKCIFVKTGMIAPSGFLDKLPEFATIGLFRKHCTKMIPT